MSNLLKNEKTVDKILLGLAVLCLIIILSLSFCAFYNGGDDYNFLIDLQNGVLQNCIRGYFDWDGRMLTLGAFAQGCFLKYLPIELVVFLWSLCFLISGLLIYKIISFEIDFSSLNKQKRLLICFMLPIVLWLGSFIHIKETIYWGTGGVYSFDLLMGAVWTFLFLKFQKQKNNLLQKTAFILFSFCAGASTQNLSIALITLVILTLTIDYLDSNKTKNKFNLLLLLVLIAGILFISLAPGNQSRINILNSTTKPENSIFYYITNFILISFHYIKWSTVLCFLTFIFGIALFYFENKIFENKINSKKLNFTTKINLTTILTQFKWLFIGFSTVTPFLTIPAVHSGRTSIYFMFFIMIFIVIFTYKNLSKFLLLDNNTDAKKPYSKIIMVAILTITIGFSGYNLKKGVTLKIAVLEREKVLKNSKDKIAYLKLIDPSLNTTIYKFNDFIENGCETIEWITQSQERYFNTKIVIEK